MQTLAQGLDAPNIQIEIEPPSSEPLLLEKGMYVHQGEEVPAELGILMQFMGMSTKGMENILPPGQRDEGSILGPFMSYGISPVTDLNINSMHYNNCIALIAIGTGHNNHQLGLQTHIVDSTTRVPLLYGNTTVCEKFRTDMYRRLEELVRSTRDRTVDTLIAGGRLSPYSSDCENELDSYIATIADLDAIVQEVVGKSATVLAPSLGNLWKYISTETQSRKVRIRPKAHQSGELFQRTFVARKIASELPKAYL